MPMTNTTILCSFSHAGTFNHECGKPATLAGSKPSQHTVSGVYWSHRCASCALERGRDNHGVRAWVPLDPAVHTNEWL